MKDPDIERANFAVGMLGVVVRVLNLSMEYASQRHQYYRNAKVSEISAGPREIRRIIMAPNY